VAHPGLIKVYEQYKTKGFTVVSISLDETKEAWQKAVAKDELTWDQFSDLKFPSPIADMYGISSFPMNFLFDPCGKIIAKNLNPDQLKQKLKEVFK
jgi:peroxiredoxin